MAKQTINIGSGELQGDGESIRSAFDKINQNFDELYNNLGSGGDANLGSLRISGTTIGTVDESDPTGWGDYDLVLDPGGESAARIYIPSVGNQGEGYPLQISNTQDPTSAIQLFGRGGVQIVTNTGEGQEVFEFGDDGKLRLPIGGDILNANGDSVLGGIQGLEITQESNTTVLAKRSENTVTEGVNSQTTIIESQIEIDPANIVITKKITEISNDGVTTSTDTAGSSLEVSNSGAFVKQYADPDGPNNNSYFQLRANGGAIIEGVQEGLPGFNYGRVNANIGAVEITTAAGGIEKAWLFDSDGNIYLPAAGDILDSNGDSVLGGAAGPIQPYLQLTNEPFIVQPAVLGTPVTVTAAASGINANFTVTITEGPTLDVGSIIVSNGGSGYTAGQRYRLWYYNIGGPDVASSIDFEVDTVGEDGAILTIINAAFVGSASNVPGTYQFVPVELRASVFDQIGPGLTLTRDYQQGIYNIDLESEYDNNTYLSPLGTEWNSDGWSDLLQLGTRSYTTWRQALNNAVGNNIVASELVMHDIANDKYYKFDFHTWGSNNGAYSYTRTEVTDPNYFRKPHNAELGDIVKEDDPAGTGIIIVRTNGAGIYNLSQEDGFVAESPVGTLWNADGWDDLSDLTTRTYVVFDLAANGYNNVLGKQFVMYVASTQTYYAIQFYEWATNGDNNFAYVRYEIDQTKINEGIAFPDGTRLKSAAGVGRVKSTAVGDRRIEEVTGYNQVSVSGVTTNYITATLSRPALNSNVIWIDSTTTTIDDIFDAGILNSASIQFSLDNINWMVWQGSITYEGNERGYVVLGSNSYNQGDTVYFRYDTGGESVVWWNAADLPGGSQDFRGAVIDYHAWTGESTIIGTIHIIDDSGENHISHQEVQSGTTDGENDDLWLVTTEGQIRYRRIDGESKTLKVHWTAKVFYGSELYD